ncbi:MAG: hypothetical protein GY913_23875 [Proteobacteria bacterium]|nr:hypothetical protein [Pseudomonadota bacterium]MCP4919953.1 hypothetical protein [Pseudomonadota bacterium]
MSNDASKAASDVLLSLARAGRSFLLYDPGNEAICGFLQDYRDSWQDYAAAHGDLDLTVRPFELLRDGEVVYKETDRERSLAFKMFRDGVRSLSIGQHASWDELLRLLSVLSIRFTGIRQQEDDLVTLLWKAGFSNIDVHAVEGFVPDEEDEEEDDIAYHAHVAVPRAQDQPLPDFGERGEVAYGDVDLDMQVTALGEADSKHLPEGALRLAELLLQHVADPESQLDAGDVHFYLDELRDFLMAEEQVGRLVRMVRLLRVHLAHDPGALDVALRRLSEPAALARIVRSIQKSHQSAPPELIELLFMLPGDHLHHLIGLLHSDRDQGSRRITRQLLEPFIEGREQYFIDQLREAEGEVSADLVRAAGHLMPERLAQLAPELVDRGDEPILTELLWQIERIGRSGELDAALLKLLNAPMAGARIKTIEAIAERRYEPAFGAVAARVDQADPVELQAIGVALARLDPTQATQLFRTWIRPGGGLLKIFAAKGDDRHCTAAVAGLEVLDDPADDDLLEWLSKKAGDEVYQLCRRALVHRRQRRRRG